METFEKAFMMMDKPDKFIELLRNNLDITLSQAKKKMKELC